MVTCFLCQKSFNNNLGGQLTNHLVDQHSMSLESYVILTEYRGIEPRCACGLCDERPVFSRGKFLTYAKFHQNFEERERRWIEKYGSPRCEFCACDVGFARGQPKKYCNASCAMKDGRGFANPDVQEKICNVVLERYGVTNVSHTQEVKDKLSKSLKGKFKGRKSSIETRQKIAASSVERWKDEEYKRQTSMKIKKSILENHQEIQRRKQWLTIKMQDSVFRENNFKSSRNRLSKLHQRLRIKLDLERIGFVSEQRVGKYFADELHLDKRVIVEIYGDYPHANPKKFDDNFIIKLAGQSFTAFDKRRADEMRISILKEMGYKVIVVWETDDITFKKKEIEDAIK
jgi:very-short-patch-repair endonuclease